MKIITIIRDVYIYVFGFLLRAVILAAVLDEHCIVIVVIVSGEKKYRIKVIVWKCDSTIYSRRTRFSARIISS